MIKKLEFEEVKIENFIPSCFYEHLPTESDFEDFKNTLKNYINNL